MQVLLIEDDDRIVDVLQHAFQDAPIELTLAQSRDAAFSLIRSGSFDLAICDLKIPPTDASGAPELEHGLAACDLLVAESPGTPVKVFSAYGTLEILGDRLARAPMRDLLGDEAVPMLEHIDKGRLPEFTKAIIEYATRLEQLHAGVEISWDGEPLELSEIEQRVVRIFARRRNGVLVKLRALKGGFSGARTVRLEVEDEDGQAVATVVGKIDVLTEVEEAKSRYEAHVSGVLLHGAYAGSPDSVVAGAGKHACVFYDLAGGDHRSLFQVLAADDGEAARAIPRIREAVEPWQRQPIPARRTVEDVRRRLLSDEALDAVKSYLPEGLVPAVLERAEASLINVRECLAHGDLHGENLLVSGTGQPVLIDYARVGRDAISLDAITLEVSPVLYPDSGIELGGWPDPEQAQQWILLEAYIADCPIPGYVQACREWARQVARGEGELLAVLYAYCARQLQYDDVDKSLAAAYVAGALERLGS
jgi:CheY-like chemotaxis protein